MSLQRIKMQDISTALVPRYAQYDKSRIYFLKFVISEVWLFPHTSLKSLLI